jgi:hypothetical protein
VSRQKRRAEDRGYVMAWDSEVPMYGDAPLAHDFVAVMGIVFVERAKFEAMGRFASHDPAVVSFENGSVSVKVFKAAGSKAWLKKALPGKVKEALEAAYADRAATMAGKIKKAHQKAKP